MKKGKTRWLLAGLALAAVMALGAACDTGTTENGGGAGSPNGGANLNNIGSSGLLELLSSTDAQSLGSSLAPAMSQWVSSGQAGIWVTGHGTVTIVPNLALLNLGVETRALTVEEARAEAAAAMTGIIDALKARGIADRDIQTRYFNISPEYTWQEVYEGSLRYNKQVLTGYRVSNSVIAKVRDTDILGVTIDDVVEAGGDATRIQSIQFTVDDPSAAQTQAREEAVLDAAAKADQFATLTGVVKGDLLFITESGGSAPVTYDYGVRTDSFAAEAAPTPISLGELEVHVYVQTVFAIANP